MKMKVYVVLASILLCGISVISAKVLPCALRETAHGSVCVCNATYCDRLNDEDTYPRTADEAVLVSSSKGGLRFQVNRLKLSTDEIFVVDDYKVVVDMIEPSVVTVHQRDINFPTWNNVFVSQRRAKIYVDRKIKHQNLIGFGGAFTGSVSHILEQIPVQLQDSVYRSYYSDQGINFNIMRVTIGGCDFDLSPWAYNEFPENDVNLSGFTKLDSRDKRKNEQIKRLVSVAQNDDINLLASAWSPPKWMKTNNAWTGPSKLQKNFYQTWADYQLRYLELMAADKMKIWAITTGNEPLNGIIGWLFVRFMSLGWTPADQAFWLDKNLGPTLRKSNYSDVLILGNDDQRYTFPFWYKKMKDAVPTSLSFLDGFAVHWYWDGIFGPSLIDETNKLFPGKIFLNTESCVGDKPYETHGPELGSWTRAEKYIRSFIQDLQHHFNGWVDWNLVLDERGGPNYVDNFVDAPVIVNLTSREEFYKQPIFYGIGHFSKFIPRGSVRIQAERSNFNLDTLAFLRPDGRIAAIIFNSGNAPVQVTVWDSVRGNIVAVIPERSVHTVIYQ